MGAGAETVVVNRGVRRRRRGRGGAREGRGRGMRAAEHVRPPDARRDAGLKEQIEAIATRFYGADGVDYLPQAEKDIARMEELGFGTGAGLHGEDPPLAQPRPAHAEPAERVSGCRCAAWSPAPGPGSSSCSAATCSACPASGKTPSLPAASTSTRTAAPSACSELARSFASRAASRRTRCPRGRASRPRRRPPPRPSCGGWRPVARAGSRPRPTVSSATTSMCTRFFPALGSGTSVKNSTGSPASRPPAAPP